MLRLLRATLVAFVLLPAAMAQAAPVVLSEFRFRGPAGGSDEFIELRNTTAVPQSIGGWVVKGCNSGGTVGDRATINAGVTLPPGGSYLLTNSSTNGGPYSGSVPGDQTYSTGIADNGGMRLENATGTIQDAVGSSSVVGTANCREAGGIVGIPTGNGDNSYERKAGGTQDTNDNAVDFSGPKAGDPQNAKGGDDAPSVSGSNPANGASNVAPGSSIAVTFSEPVTITPSGFTLACGGATQSTTTTQGSPTSATVDPDADLPRGQSCTLTIAASAVQDTDAVDPPNEMTNSAAITFTTEGLRLRIREIQGAAHRSPYEGRPVDDVPGVVTAVNADGFWMQDTEPDSDDATSEGIFVFRSSPRPAVGDSVTVDGQVQEFRPGGAATFNLTTTEISGSPRVTIVGAGEVEPTVVGPGGRVPPTQIIEDDGTGDVELGGFLFDPAEDGLDFHESLEGMLVSLAAPEVVGPTTSNEELAVLPSGHGSPRTARGGILMRPDDLNPERVILDDAVLLARQPAQTIPPANVGDTLVGPIEAVVDYSFGNPKYLVTTVPVVNDNGLQPEVTEAPRANQLAMASMNVENLAADDPNLSAEEETEKFERLAGQLVTNLRSPDIVAVEEIQDANGTTNNGNVDAGPTYNRFIDAIVDAGGPRYEYRQINPVNNSDGGAGGGNIRVGFLFRTDRGVEFVDRPGGTAINETDVVATRKGAQLTFSPGRLQDGDPTTFAASRKPLAGEFLWKGRTVIAIANHFNSKGGDDPLFGRRQPPVAGTEVQRHKQARVLAGFVKDVLAADPRAAVAVLGDLNDFDFSETLDIVEGAGLNNLMDTLPTEERYSYVFDGNSQVLDQILVSDELMTPAPEYDSVHVNAEFADQASDHDPQVARVVVRGTGNANGQ